MMLCLADDTTEMEHDAASHNTGLVGRKPEKNKLNCRQREYLNHSFGKSTCKGLKHKETVEKKLMTRSLNSNKQLLIRL